VALDLNKSCCWSKTSQSIMKHLLLSLVLLAFLRPARAAEDGSIWHTSLPAAQATAKEGSKMVLLDFTGSDWCGWCKVLKKEVFQTPEFLDYAKKNLVLVEVDFPQRKKQSAELKKANEELQERFKVRYYPTIILLNSAGKVLGELGYQEGGAKPFIAELEKLRRKG